MFTEKRIEGFFVKRKRKGAFSQKKGEEKFGSHSGEFKVGEAQKKIVNYADQMKKGRRAISCFFLGRKKKRRKMKIYYILKDRPMLSLAEEGGKEEKVSPLQGTWAREGGDNKGPFSLAPGERGGNFLPQKEEKKTVTISLVGQPNKGDLLLGEGGKGGRGSSTQLPKRGILYGS